MRTCEQIMDEYEVIKRTAPEVIYISPDPVEKVKDFYNNINYVNLMSMLNAEDAELFDDLCECVCSVFFAGKDKYYLMSGIKYKRIQITSKLLRLKQKDMLKAINRLSKYVINVPDKEMVYLPVLCNMPL